ncbi:MAG: hypothetical protein NC400_07530 [Clostridium sp.]|nr:hypothetical protein [Clostridium sp.]
MKKSSFITLVLGVIGGLFFALGMCMTLVPEWDMRSQGIPCTAAGLVILIATAVIGYKLSGKGPIKLNVKTVGAVVVGIFGALLLGVGMALTMAFEQLIAGIVIGIIGIAVLLMLIPLTKGLK